MITTGDGSNFMFGLRVTDLLQTMINLNQAKRYFDLSLIITKIESSQIQSLTPVATVPCTVEHWKKFPTIQAKFDKLQMNKWLCPPLDFNFTIKGSLSSSSASLFMIAATECSNYSNTNTSVCASSKEID